MKKNFALAYDLASEGKVVLLLGLRVSHMGMQRCAVYNKMEEIGIEFMISGEDELLTNEQILFREEVKKNLTEFEKTHYIIYKDCHNYKIKQLKEVVDSATKHYEITDVVVDNYDELDGEKYYIGAFASDIKKQYGINVHYEGKA